MFIIHNLLNIFRSSMFDFNSIYLLSIFICNKSAQRESGHSATGRLLYNVGAIWQVSTVLNKARCKYDRCLKAIFLHDKSTTDKITAVKITTDKSTIGCGESRARLLQLAQTLHAS